METRPHTGKVAYTRALGLASTVLLTCLASGQANSAPAPQSSPVLQTAPSSADKQKAAHADADRLLALAQELKTSVDKSRKDELNVQVIRQAEEIEKLARSLRSRVQ